MNVAKILELADAVEHAAPLTDESGFRESFQHQLMQKMSGRPPKFFRMDSVLQEHDCGTAGCMIGFGLCMWPDEDSIQDALGLDTDQADALFTPCGYHEPRLQTTRFHPRNAARVLRHLAVSGEVKWPE